MFWNNIFYKINNKLFVFNLFSKFLNTIQKTIIFKSNYKLKYLNKILN